MRLDDPELVRAEYASEAGLRARASVYAGIAGPDARELVVEAVLEAAPSAVLEVGCGWGDLAARLAAETGARIVAIDQSPRMVELARERGVDAHEGDVQALGYDDGSFDVVVAAWMLYHVRDLDLALSEIARVLRPGGRLVAATNGLGHLGELWRLVGRDRSAEPVRFFAETAEEPLRRHFARVARRDVRSEVVFADADAVRGYIGSSVAHKHLAERVPELDAPLVAHRVNAIFVAERAA